MGWREIIALAGKYSKNGASFFILQQVRDRNIQIALSVPLFEEYEAVLKRQKSLKEFGLDLEDVNKFLRFIAYVGKPYKTSPATLKILELLN